MFLRTIICYSAITATSTLFTLSAQTPEGKPGIQAKVAALKEAASRNKASLRGYQWTETTTVLLKGKEKKTEVSICQYGADGKVQKTPLGTTPEPAAAQSSHRGGRLKTSIVEKKTAEMKDYSTRLKSLIGEYIPPNPEKIGDTMKAGNASLVPVESLASLTFSDYYKSGDKLTFFFDMATKKILTFNINTYLDDPKKDIVTLTATYASLPDGTNYVATTDLKAESKSIEIRTVNSSYQKIVQ